MLIMKLRAWSALVIALRCAQALEMHLKNVTLKVRLFDQHFSSMHIKCSVLKNMLHTQRSFDIQELTLIVLVDGTKRDCV